MNAERTNSILFNLSQLKYATRRQLQTIHNLQGTRNAQKVMKDLVDSNLLLTTKHKNENVYYLSKYGANMIGVKPVKKTGQVEHILLRNEAWMWLNLPSWDVETPIELNIQGKQKILIPDAQYQTDTLYCVEIDNQQRFIRNKEKIDMYKVLSKMYEKKHHKKMILQFFTTCQSRKKKIEEVADGLICEVYVINY